MRQRCWSSRGWLGTPACAICGSSGRSEQSQSIVAIFWVQLPAAGRIGVHDARRVFRQAELPEQLCTLVFTEHAVPLLEQELVHLSLSGARHAVPRLRLLLRHSQGFANAAHMERTWRAGKAEDRQPAKKRHVCRQLVQGRSWRSFGYVRNTSAQDPMIRLTECLFVLATIAQH